VRRQKAKALLLKIIKIKKTLDSGSVAGMTRKKKSKILHFVQDDNKKRHWIAVGRNLLLQFLHFRQSLPRERSECIAYPRRSRRNDKVRDFSLLVE